MKTQIVIAFLLLIFSNDAFGRPSKGLPFINDDFEKATAEAKQRRVPIFVEVWAPW